MCTAITSEHLIHSAVSDGLRFSYAQSTPVVNMTQQSENSKATVCLEDIWYIERYY